MPILSPIPRNERRQMRKIAQKTQDKKYAIRIVAILLLYQGKSVFLVTEELCTTPSSVWRWIKCFRTYGWFGLKSKPAGCHQKWNLACLLPFLVYLLELSPQQFSYVRSRWSLELFIRQIYKLTNVTLSISTLYRFLCKNNIVWRQVAPTLHQPDPEYEEKMAYNNQALLKASKEEPIFYEDKVDIHFNSKINSDWYFKGQQKRIIALGKNQKYYLAGYLSAQIREIFYSPWLNKIERLWQSLHETVTRNHCCQHI